MKKFLYLLLAAGLLYACKKDKIGSKPLLYFKSYQPDSITPDTKQFILTMRVEDGDGDIEDSIAVGMLKDSEQAITKDTIWTFFKMPKIGQNRGNSVKADVIMPFGEIDFAAAYNPAPGDSAHYVVFLRDNSGNISDTVATPKFPFRRNR
ncbi:hypothetical protein HGH92_03570 [Chitinophaga varians]|uniref:DUF4625 domain-containing protein n=1 Tax=Chitinophaga varians TaxID=2202339 RepID=A0A847RJP7_9BACT|nr:hypothetical protein [Chitinophaga varians]NLR63376.1 hypothetical protein [Chitinophaga varians]